VVCPPQVHDWKLGPQLGSVEMGEPLRGGDSWRSWGSTLMNVFVLLDGKDGSYWSELGFESGLLQGKATPRACPFLTQFVPYVSLQYGGIVTGALDRILVPLPIWTLQPPES
jgi:hypothetical protein